MKLPMSLQLMTKTSETHNVPVFDESRDSVRKIDKVVNDEEMYDEGEARPATTVLEKVKELIRESQRFMILLRFPIAEVRPFDGALRITWTTKAKNVRLVCSDSERDYIFCEKLRRGKLVDYGVHSDVNPRSLARWLNWLRFKL